jgi:hypothetical protein
MVFRPIRPLMYSTVCGSLKCHSSERTTSESTVSSYTTEILKAIPFCCKSSSKERLYVKVLSVKWLSGSLNANSALISIPL